MASRSSPQIPGQGKLAPHPSSSPCMPPPLLWSPNLEQQYLPIFHPPPSTVPPSPVQSHPILGPTTFRPGPPVGFSPENRTNQLGQQNSFFTPLPNCFHPDGSSSDRMNRSNQQLQYKGGLQHQDLRNFDTRFVQNGPLADVQQPFPNPFEVNSKVQSWNANQNTTPTEPFSRQTSSPIELTPFGRVKRPLEIKPPDKKKSSGAKGLNPMVSEFTPKSTSRSSSFSDEFDCPHTEVSKAEQEANLTKDKVGTPSKTLAACNTNDNAAESVPLASTPVSEPQMKSRPLATSDHSHRGKEDTTSKKMSTGWSTWEQSKKSVTDNISLKPGVEETPKDEWKFAYNQQVTGNKRHKSSQTESLVQMERRKVKDSASSNHKVVNLQAEVCHLRAQLCLNELQRQCFHLELDMYWWRSCFKPVDSSKVSHTMNDALKKLQDLQAQIRQIEMKRDHCLGILKNGRELLEVPNFNISLSSGEMVAPVHAATKGSGLFECPTSRQASAAVSMSSPSAVHRKEIPPEAISLSASLSETSCSKKQKLEAVEPCKKKASAYKESIERTGIKVKKTLTSVSPMLSIATCSGAQYVPSGNEKLLSIDQATTAVADPYGLSKSASFLSTESESASVEQSKSAAEVESKAEQESEEEHNKVVLDISDGNSESLSVLLDNMHILEDSDNVLMSESLFDKPVDGQGAEIIDEKFPLKNLKGRQLSTDLSKEQSLLSTDGEKLLDHTEEKQVPKNLGTDQDFEKIDQEKEFGIESAFEGLQVGTPFALKKEGPEEDEVFYDFDNSHAEAEEKKSIDLSNKSSEMCLNANNYFSEIDSSGSKDTSSSIHISSDTSPGLKTDSVSGPGEDACYGLTSHSPDSSESKQASSSLHLSADASLYRNTDNVLSLGEDTSYDLIELTSHSLDSSKSKEISSSLHVSSNSEHTNETSSNHQSSSVMTGTDELSSQASGATRDMNTSDQGAGDDAAAEENVAITLSTVEQIDDGGNVLEPDGTGVDAGLEEKDTGTSSTEKMNDSENVLTTEGTCVDIIQQNGTRTLFTVEETGENAFTSDGDGDDSTPEPIGTRALSTLEQIDDSGNAFTSDLGCDNAAVEQNGTKTLSPKEQINDSENVLTAMYAGFDVTPEQNVTETLSTKEQIDDNENVVASDSAGDDAAFEQNGSSSVSTVEKVSDSVDVLTSDRSDSADVLTSDSIRNSAVALSSLEQTHDRGNVLTSDIRGNDAAVEQNRTEALSTKEQKDDSGYILTLIQDAESFGEKKNEEEMPSQGDGAEEKKIPTEKDGVEMAGLEETVIVLHEKVTCTKPEKTDGTREANTRARKKHVDLLAIESDSDDDQSTSQSQSTAIVVTDSAAETAADVNTKSTDVLEPEEDKVEQTLKESAVETASLSSPALLSTEENQDTLDEDTSTQSSVLVAINDNLSSSFQDESKIGSSTNPEEWNPTSIDACKTEEERGGDSDGIVSKTDPKQVLWSVTVKLKELYPTQSVDSEWLKKTAEEQTRIFLQQLDFMMDKAGNGNMHTPPKTPKLSLTGLATDLSSPQQTGISQQPLEQGADAVQKPTQTPDSVEHAQQQKWETLRPLSAMNRTDVILAQREEVIAKRRNALDRQNKNLEKAADIQQILLALNQRVLADPGNVHLATQAECKLKEYQVLLDDAEKLEQEVSRLDQQQRALLLQLQAVVPNPLNVPARLQNPQQASVTISKPASNSFQQNPQPVVSDGKSAFASIQATYPLFFKPQAPVQTGHPNLLPAYPFPHQPTTSTSAPFCPGLRPPVDPPAAPVFNFGNFASNSQAPGATGIFANMPPNQLNSNSKSFSHSGAAGLMVNMQSSSFAFSMAHPLVNLLHNVPGANKTSPSPNWPTSTLASNIAGHPTNLLASNSKGFVGGLPRSSLAPSISGFFSSLSSNTDPLVFASDQRTIHGQQDLKTTVSSSTKAGTHSGQSLPLVDPAIAAYKGPSIKVTSFDGLAASKVDTSGSRSSVAIVTSADGGVLPGKSTSGPISDSSTSSFVAPNCIFTATSAITSPSSRNKNTALSTIWKLQRLGSPKSQFSTTTITGTSTVSTTSGTATSTTNTTTTSTTDTITTSVVSITSSATTSTSATSITSLATITTTATNTTTTASVVSITSIATTSTSAVIISAAITATNAAKTTTSAATTTPSSPPAFEPVLPLKPIKLSRNRYAALAPLCFNMSDKEESPKAAPVPKSLTALFMGEAGAAVKERAEQQSRGPKNAATDSAEEELVLSKRRGTLNQEDKPVVNLETSSQDGDNGEWQVSTSKKKKSRSKSRSRKAQKQQRKRGSVPPVTPMEKSKDRRSCSRSSSSDSTQQSDSDHFTFHCSTPARGLSHAPPPASSFACARSAASKTSSLAENWEDECIPFPVIRSMSSSTPVRLTCSSWPKSEASAHQDVPLSNPALGRSLGAQKIPSLLSLKPRKLPSLLSIETKRAFSEQPQQWNNWSNRSSGSAAPQLNQFSFSKELKQHSEASSRPRFNVNMGFLEKLVRNNEQDNRSRDSSISPTLDLTQRNAFSPSPTGTASGGDNTWPCSVDEKEWPKTGEKEKCELAQPVPLQQTSTDSAGAASTEGATPKLTAYRRLCMTIEKDFPNLKMEDINQVINEVKRSYGGHFHGKLFSDIIKDVHKVVLRDFPERLRSTHQAMPVFTSMNLQDKLQKPVAKRGAGWLQSGQVSGTLSKLDNTEDECSICLIEFLSKTRYPLECGHTFHKKCIDKWVKDQGERTCPLCRTIVLMAEDFPHLSQTSSRQKRDFSSLDSDFPKLGS